MEKRIIWVEFAKCLGIFCVVWGHFFPWRFVPFIYSFNVPLFFFLSGYLSKDTPKDRIGYHLRKVGRTLAIPLVLIVCANWLIQLFIYGREAVHVELYYYLMVLCGDQLSIGPLWFVYDLLLIKVVVILFNFNKRVWWLLVVIPMIYLLDILDVHRQTPDVTIWGGFLFFTFGEMYKRVESMLPAIAKQWWMLVSVISSALIYWFDNDFYIMCCADYQTSVSLTLSFSVLGIIMIIGLAKQFSYIPDLLKIVSSGSLLILGFHITIVNFLLPFTRNNLLIFGMSILIIILFVPLILFCQRFVPVLIGYRK